MATPTQAVFDPTAPYQSAAQRPAAPQSAMPQPASSPTVGAQSKPTFDPNASYEPAPLPGFSDAKTPGTSNMPPAWEPSSGDPLVRIQTSDGKQWHLHAHDLEKAKQRDPGLKVFESFTHTPEEDARSRTLMNMTRAMSGQPMDNPEDQAEAEKGRQAGTIQGGIDIAGGALLGPALEFLGFGGGRVAEEATKQGVKKVGTGILDEYGNEIFKEVSPEAKKVAGKILQHPIVTKAVKMAVKKILGEEAGRRAGQAMGGEPGGYAGATLGALVGDKVLNWILAD
jgi:hypothetical protein